MANEIKVQSNSKKTKWIIIIVAILVALATLAAVIFVPKSAKARKVEEQLSLGTKYLTELDYEQAIVAYEAAIKIDPKCTDAYLGLADVYEEMGEFDKAAEVLAEAKQVIEDKDEVVRIEKKQEKVEEKKQEAKKPVATATPAPTATPVPTVAPTATPLPTSTPVPAPTEVPVVTETPVATATPKPTEAPKPTATPKATATPVPTAVPVVEEKEVELKLTADCFTYEQVEADYLCTGFSAKGYAEYKKYGEKTTVSVLLPSVSDTGKSVVGFASMSEDGYSLTTMMNEDTAYLELVCPENYTVYYGMHFQCYGWESTYRNMYKLTGVVLNDGIKEIKSCAFYKCSGLTEMVIPEGITELAPDLFWGCSELRKVTLPERIEVYGGGAFRECEKLVFDTIELGGKKVESSAFEGVTIKCLSLNGPVEFNHYNDWSSATVETVKIADGMEEIPNYIFIGCDEVKEIKLPGSVRTIGYSAFSGCSSLTEVVIPESVTEICPGAFSYCTGLKKVTLPESVKMYGDYAFAGCGNLVIDTLELSGKTFGAEVFGGATIKRVTLSGPAELSLYETWRNAKLESVKIAEGVEEIPHYAFMEYDGLGEMIIPSSVKNIGVSAFYGCDGLTLVTTPGSAADIYATENSISVRYQ